MAWGAFSPNLALSNGKRTVKVPSSSVTSNLLSVAGSRFVVSGKYYWEIVDSTDGGLSGSSDLRVGLSNPSFSPTTDTVGIGASSNAYQWSTISGVGTLTYNSVFQQNAPAFVAGDRLRVAFDADNHKLWLAVGSGAWIGAGGGAGTPDTNTNGITLAPALYSAGLAPTLTYKPTPNNSATANFSTNSWAFSAPSGFITIESPFASDFSSAFGGITDSGLTSNIHIGLAAWQQNHAYILGARVSNASVAFQCITSGTSQNTGSGPVGSGSDITDGTVHWKWLSAIDYNSIQSWANALPSVLSTSSVGLLWNNGPITTTSGVPVLTLSGHTTSSSVTITLTCAPGESHRDATGPVAFSSTNGAAIVLPASGAGNTNYIFVGDSNVTIDAIQFQDPNGGSKSSIIAATAGNFRLSNCILDGFAQPGPPAANIIDIQSGCSSFIIDNCLVIDRSATHSNDSNTIECFALTQIGVVINCTFLSVVNNTLSVAVQADNTNSSGVLARNSVFFGWTVPLNAASIGAIAADHCCTDVTAFAGNVTNGSGNLFSRIATNQFINAATDFRLKAGADCIDGGVVDLTNIPSSDDVRKTPRPSIGSWDIGLFQSGVLVSKLIQVILSEKVASLKGAKKLLGVKTRPWSIDFSFDFGPFISGMSANVIKQKISGNVKSVALASSELSRLVKAFGLSKLQAASSFSAAFDKEFIRINITAAVLFQVIHIPNRAIARSIFGATSQAARAARLISRISSLTSGSSAKAVNVVTKIFNGVTPLLVSVKRLISTNKNNTQSQTAAFTNKTVGHTLFTSLSQIAFQTRGATQSIIKLISLAISDVASFARNLSAFRSISAFDSQAASSFQGRRSTIIASASQIYLSFISHASGHIAGTITQQIISSVSGVAHFTLALSSEVVVVLKTVGLHSSALSTASQIIMRLIGKFLTVLSTQSTLVTKLISRVSSAVSSQLATKFILQAPTKLVTATSSQITYVVRSSSHIAQAALGAAQILVRMSSRALSVATGYATSVGGLSAALAKSLFVSESYIASLLRGVGFSKTSFNAQSARLTTQRGFITFILVPNSVSRHVAVSITRIAVNPEIVAAGKQGSGKIYTSSLSSVVNITTPRSATLSAILSPLASLVKWFHFFNPHHPSVLLPPLDGPAEPPSFSAMDPADQERFVFDWSARSEPNDPIASVQVISTPPGMNFVGPIFVDNLQVEVTLGPFSPPQLPMTYGLRCSVTFVSGRRSSYTIPIPVRIL